MANCWMGLSTAEGRPDVERALAQVDRDARVTFVRSAWQLREGVLRHEGPVGVIVGPTSDNDVSSLNVAAAIARDGMAQDVVVVCRDAAPGIRERVSQMGIRLVVTSDLDACSMPDLDEPRLVEDELPTMVLGSKSWGSMASLPGLDEVGERPAGKRDALGSRNDGRRSSSATSKGRQIAKDSRSEDEIPVLRTTSAGVEVVMRPAREPADASGGGAGDSHAEGEGARAPMITFVSGRGGVGKTALVAAMSYVASTWGMRVASCDLDLTCGNLYSYLGARGPADLSTLVGEHELDIERVRSCGREVSRRITLWGPSSLPEMAEAISPSVHDLLLALAGEVDLVLVDTSTTFTDAVAQAAQACDRLVLVVDGKPGSLAAQSRLGALAVRLGVARTRIVRLANRCGPRGRGEPQINRADVGLETARPLRVLDGGAEVTDCLAEGKVGELFELESRFAESASTALAKLLKELGALPSAEGALKALEGGHERNRWAFGRRKEAV